MARDLEGAARILFLEIHEEFEAQSPTITGPTPYSEALLNLQQRLLRKTDDVAKIRLEFEALKKSGVTH